MSTHSENKTCQNCKNSFVIEPEDFDFYEKIKVPPPTFCPECRFIRRLLWRNERTLYKRPCSLCDQDTISLYDKDAPFPVFCVPCYWSDKWDPLSYGQRVDLERSFFEQLKELMDRAPRIALDITGPTNSPYTNHSINAKDSYYSFGITQVEKCSYDTQTHFSKEVYDSDFIIKGDSLYECVDTDESYNVKYSKYAKQCIDSEFLYNCIGCTNCFMSSNLRNKQYYFKNQPCTKSEYEEKIKQIDFSKRSVIENLKKDFDELLKTTLRRFANITTSTNSTGDNLEHSDNVHYSFGTRGGVQNAKYIAIAGYNLKDTYDIYGGGLTSELGYECVAFTNNSSVMFSKQTRDTRNAMYTEFCTNCESVFACSGLSNKSYCILNTEYSKEEYEKIVAQLIENSIKNPYKTALGHAYSYGEFFPVEFSPFAYDETVAHELMPLTREDALKKVYGWKGEKDRDYVVDIVSSNIPDSILDVGDDMVSKVLGCAHSGECIHKCTKAFKFTQDELHFYKKRNIPLPDLCPNCRYFKRLEKEILSSYGIARA